VQWELDDLAKVFELDYGFETEKWLIPSADPLFSFTKMALETVENYGSQGNLLIVYYGGHGFINSETIYLGLVSSTLTCFITYNAEIQQQ
jgi:hypothetical protein